MNDSIRMARQLVASELLNLLRVRRSLIQLRRTTHAGNENGLVRTPMGLHTRGYLLAIAERTFSQVVKRVCLARRALFIEMEAAEPVGTVR